MKRMSIRSASVLLTASIVMGFLSQCNSGNEGVYLRLRNHADGIKVINTHEHQRLPEAYGDYDFGFYHLMAASYLSADVTSAGADAGNWELIDSLGTDELWDVYGEALDHSRGTSYYSHFVRGFRKLYGFNDLYFTRENISSLSKAIEENYGDYGSWFGKAFNKSGFEIMFVDQFWKPFNTELDNRYFALVFQVGPLITEAGRKPENGDQLKSVYRLAAEAGHEIATIDDYLAFCDTLFRRNIRSGAVCIKNAQAYERSLYYEDVPYEEALALYSRPSASLTTQEIKKLEDYTFHWLIRQATGYDLPVQIHTGYLAGNGNVLENGDPLKLNNLFLKYPQAKFDIFHGAFPWTDEFTALGKMFPNVYLNLVWLPQISREKAVSTLDVMLDCVPYNKILWGGDCGLIEESAGSLEFGKDVVCEVLAGRIKRGLLTEEAALDIVEGIFRSNAIRLFRLSI
jgi:hypothetical protein